MALRNRLIRAEAKAEGLLDEIILPGGSTMRFKPPDLFDAAVSLLEEDAAPHPLAERILELGLDGPVPDADPFVNIVLRLSGRARDE
jgi:hypothetical protein